VEVDPTVVGFTTECIGDRYTNLTHSALSYHQLREVIGKPDALASIIFDGNVTRQPGGSGVAATLRLDGSVVGQESGTGEHGRNPDDP